MSQKQVLLKFEIPSELQSGRIDLAEVSVDIEVGTDKKERVAVMISASRKCYPEK